MYAHIPTQHKLIFATRMGNMSMASIFFFKLIIQLGLVYLISIKANLNCSASFICQNR